MPHLPEATGPEGKTSLTHLETKKILLLGESTIAGIGVKTHQEGLAGQLAQGLAEQLHYNIDWKVIAKSGFTTKKVTQRLLPQISPDLLDLIVIGLGGNDTFTLNTRWSRDIKDLIYQLRLIQPACPLLFINLPPVGEFPALPSILRFCLDNHMDKLSAQLIDIVQKETDCYFISDKITLKEWSTKFGLENKVELYFSDGIHPEKLTYQIWGQSVAEFICKEKLI